MKQRITKYLLFVLNIIILILAFLLVAKMRSGTRVIISNYWRSVIPFVLIWVGAGMWGLKYSLGSVQNGAEMLRRVLKCDMLAALIVFVAMYIFNKFYYSRYIVLGTMLISVGAELIIFIGVYYSLRFNQENKSFASPRLITDSKAMEDMQSPKFFIPEEPFQIPTISDKEYIPAFATEIVADSVMVPFFEKYLAKQSELFEFLTQYLDLARFSRNKSLVLESDSIFNIQSEEEGSRHLFMNLHKINDFRRLNAYLIQVNRILQPGGVFICKGQTIGERRREFYQRFTPYMGVFLYFFDFLFRRVSPKLPIIQGWYFAITKGKNRALSETEIMGRFYFCGFELIHKREIDNMMHFILKKSAEPRDDKNPSYGPLIRLKRRGKGGKIIYVKKFRTMHPYSEYLQSYVHATNSLQEGGKFKDDFRITSWGRIMRKLWIDELPQFLNFFAGELSLVGVRALSEHYFSLYPPDMQELRLKVKPGLLPPFYADMPKTFEEIVESERKYLLQKLEKPFRTDFKYFFKSTWNILVKRARSN